MITIRYFFNEKYFDIIDTEDKAYWLGFIWCDGYVCKRKRKMWINYETKLSLSEKDSEHLELFKKYLKSNHKINYYKINNGFPTQYKEARLLICNTNLGSVLYDKYGMIPNRINCDKLIRNIPKKYYRDLIRGIFDAEGSILDKNIKYKKHERKEFSIGISTNENILIFINQILIENQLTSTYYKLTTRHEGKDKCCKSIRITGNNIIYNILNWLYGDSIVYLNRKYKKYIDIKNYMNEYINENGGLKDEKSKIIFSR